MSSKSDPFIPFLPFVYELIKTNDPPSDNEKLAIETAIHNAQQRLSIIDQTDVSGDGNPLTLQQAAESDRLQSFVKSGSAILSPVRRVPPEVLGSIMELSPCDVSSDVVVGPLHFTHVSQLWRQTAIGLPSLWTNIQVNISTNRTNSGLADLIEEILSRSKEHPLSVTLSLQQYNEVSVRLLDLLVAASNRRGSFSIALKRHEHFLRLLPTMKLKPASNNHVTSLSLETGYEGHTVQLHLPNLLRLETSDSIQAIGGNFPELRELFLHENIDRMESHVINNILSTSTKLQYLTLSEWGPRTSFYSGHLFRILNAAPSIEVLRLYPRGRPWEQNKDAIFSLIARLALRHVGTLPNQMSFPVLPRLTHLLLHLPKELAYSVRLISGSEMQSKIRSRASELAVSPDFQNSRLRRIWIQDGNCRSYASKLEKLHGKQIVDGEPVEVCIARPLIPALGWEVGLVDLSTSGEITSVVKNYM